MTHNKSDIQSLLNKYPLLIDKAIQLIGDNQTADELGSKHTKYNNGIGFTASYGKRLQKTRPSSSMEA